MTGTAPQPEREHPGTPDQPEPEQEPSRPDIPDQARPSYSEPDDGDQDDDGEVIHDA
jgi:hypothetical protein